MQDLSRITATEAVRLIRDGRVEPMEIMEACLRILEAGGAIAPAT